MRRTILPKPPALNAFVALLCAALFASCGGGAEEENDTTPAPEPERFPALEEAEPLDLKALAADDQLGVSVRHGELRALKENDPSARVRATALFPHALYRVQAYDELARFYGEYTTYSINAADAEDARVFLMDRSRGLLDRRVEDLSEEVGGAFERTSIVVDFWRTNQEWFVRWDGLLDQEINRLGIGPYGMGRPDMREDLLDHIETIAAAKTPHYMILGEGMEQLWLKTTEGGVDVYKSEWFAFLSFYQQAVTRIKAASPETQVGVGINWDVFTQEVTLEYARLSGRAASETKLDEALLDETFRAILLPLTEWGDLLTLRSYRAPGEANAWTYQFLRRLPDLYGAPIGVVWYDIGTPTQGSATAQRQRSYLNDFLEWNAGVPVEAVFWSRLLNVDGADGANQTITGRCQSMVEDEDKNLQFPRDRCFDGAFDSLFQTKPALLFLEQQVQ